MLVYQRVIHKIIIWLVGATYPSEKWWSESQLGWLFHSIPKCFWKVIKKIFQSPTRTQSFFAKKSPTFQHTPFSGQGAPQQWSHVAQRLVLQPTADGNWLIYEESVAGVNPSCQKGVPISGENLVKSSRKTGVLCSCCCFCSSKRCSSCNFSRSFQRSSCAFTSAEMRTRKNQTRGVLKCGIL